MRSVAQAFAGIDPTSLHFAKSSAAAQRAFWLHYIAPHILDSEPRLNFLAKGGGGAIVANLLPAQEVCSFSAGSVCCRRTPPRCNHCTRPACVQTVPRHGVCDSVLHVAAGHHCGHLTVAMRLLGAGDAAQLHLLRGVACCCRVAGWHVLTCLPYISRKPALDSHLTGCLLLQSGWLAGTWQGLRLLLAAVPRSKWRETAAYGDYLKAKQREFQKVPPINSAAKHSWPQAVAQRT